MLKRLSFRAPDNRTPRCLCSNPDVTPPAFSIDRTTPSWSFFGDAKAYHDRSPRGIYAEGWKKTLSEPRFAELLRAGWLTINCRRISQEHSRKPIAQGHTGHSGHSFD
jgi:hypothetical protein